MEIIAGNLYSTEDGKVVKATVSGTVRTKGGNITFEGIVVLSNNTSHHPVGHKTNMWAYEFFKPFKGEIIPKLDYEIY